MRCSQSAGFLARACFSFVVLGELVACSPTGGAAGDEPIATTTKAITCWGTLTEVGTGPNGSSQCDAATGARTLTSSKSGVVSGSVTATSTEDNMLFVHVPALSDHEELVVKLSSFTGSVDAQAGVAIREDVLPGAKKVVAGLVRLDKCDNCAQRGHPDDQFQVIGRGPDGGFESIDDAPLGTLPTETPPRDIYFRLQRVGNDVVITRSKDKTLWIPLVGYSGGAFAVSPAASPQLGFFVAGGTSSASATFDVDYQGPVRYPAETSFATEGIGATTSSHSTGFISRGGSSIYVGPDGSIYKTNNGGDGPDMTQRYLDHVWVRSVFQPGAKQAALTGDGTYVYLMECGAGFDASCGVRRYFPDLTEAPLAATPPRASIQQPGGFAVTTSEGYASEVSTNKIVAMDPSTFSELRRFDFPPDSPPGSCGGPPEPGAQPGPIAVDESGRLWVVQPSVNYPIGGQYDLKRQANLYCVTSTGDCCGRINLGSGSNPSAIVYDSDGDRLLITDSGQAWQNVRIFSVPAAPGMPVEGTAFGQPGGVYSGATPGLLVDPAAGNGRRFYTPTGVGVDASGAIYVSSGRQVDIRKFSVGATTPDWGMYGLIEGANGAFDPASDGADFYTTTQHFRFDPNGSTPDTRWKLHAITWNPFAPEYDTEGNPLLHEEGNRVGSTPILVRISGQLFMYTVGPDDDPKNPARELNEGLHVHRFQGEQAIRCARIWGNNISGTKYLNVWTDAGTSPNGREDPGETPPPQAEPALNSARNSATLTSAGGHSVDAEGTIWFALGYSLNQPPGATVIRLRASGLVGGVPAYSLATTGSPPPLSKFPTPYPFVSVERVFHDVTTDDLYVIGNLPQCSGSSCNGFPSGVEGYTAVGPLGVASGYLFLTAYGRYANWSSQSPSSPTPTYVKVAPNQPTSGDFIRRFAPYYGVTQKTPPEPELQWDGNSSNGYRAITFAGDKLFFAWRSGPIHAMDGPTGNHMAVLWAGPEVSGWHNWQDGQDLTHATKRSNGEYLVTATDSGHLSRAILMRWHPPASAPPAPACLPNAPFGPLTPAFTGTTPADGLTISSDGRTAYVSSKQGTSYDLYRAVRTDVALPFGPLAPLVNNVNTSADERAPSLSPDGRTLYYTKRVGYDDLYKVTRNLLTDEFSSPEPLGFNSGVHDQDPFFLASQNALYFASERPNGAQRDLYVSTLSGTSFGPISLVSGDVSSGNYEDYRPVLTADGTRAYFASNRAGIGGDTNGDVFVANLSSPGTFGNAVNLAGLSSSGVDIPVALSPDGCTLYVASNRDTGLGSSSTLRLFQATRGPSIPSSATVTLQVTGNAGSVTTSPFNCSNNNVGTCTAQGTPDSTQVLWASGSALWTGSCTGNNGNPSSDGVLVYTPGGVCTVTIQ